MWKFGGRAPAGAGAPIGDLYLEAPAHFCGIGIDAVGAVEFQSKIEQA